MPAPKPILELVERFERNAEAYRSAGYNETQVRREFIDPMFKALGWDMDNAQGYAEAYKDVIHEDAIKMGGATKAPDYCFRIGGARKFFLEAKKPAVRLGDDASPAYQLRRYAWSAKLPLSVLTDFEEFAVYDCRVRPAPTDKPATARVLWLRYSEYAERWDEIAAVFHRDAVLKGSFDKYAESTGRKRGTAEVDAAFLAEIETWREALARNVALRNAALSQRDLNYAVQMTIDRVIFLRICEDRGIEDYGRLQALLNGTEVYARLRELFVHADYRYNSGLFHFQKEKDRPATPDTLTPGLAIDDKSLKDIFRSLYYPDSPYEFSVLGADILGQVYEQFLGKVIRLTAGHRAVVEEKPEVRKAGGVYYTPTYIVDYIVRNTVGKLLEGRKAGPRGSASRLRILDPACGSGSFLLGAYQHLLDWHVREYTAGDPKKWATGRNPALFQNRRGEWQLTTPERKRILLNNIYGVDIDSQAVEVTKLSLLLKVLENESAETLQRQLTLFHERALPDLAANIKCGNSLIGPDFHEGRQGDLFDEEEVYRINAFDWGKEFAEIMQGGGFDAVIGNPPYIRIQMMKEWAPVEVEFYKKRYEAASSGNYDIYVVFVEKGLGLLSARGRLGFILPHKFFNAQYGAPLRGIISKGKHLAHVVHFSDQQVFKGATTYTCLLFLDRAGAADCRFEKVADLAGWIAERKATSILSVVAQPPPAVSLDQAQAARKRRGKTEEESQPRAAVPQMAEQGKQPESGESSPPSTTGTIPAADIAVEEWSFNVGKDSRLLTRLGDLPVKLGAIADIFVGLQTSADTVFLFADSTPSSRRVTRVYSKELGDYVEVESSLLKRVVRSGQISRYCASSTATVVFPYETRGGRAKLIGESEMRKEYPRAWSYLLRCRDLLVRREHGKFRDSGWWQLYPKNLDRWEQPKIMLPYMITRLAAYFDPEGLYFVNVTTGGFGITIPAERGNPRYFTGLLNSTLLDRYLEAVSTSFHGGYYAANKQFLVQLPIVLPDRQGSQDRQNHDDIVSLVSRMLALHRRLQDLKTEHDRTVLQRQIDATDHEIDRMVYELYGLTDEEIAIMEGAK